MVRPLLFIACFGALTISAQTAVHRPTKQQQSGTEQKQYEELAAKVAALEKRITSLETSVEVNQYAISVKADKHDTALLDPSSREYQRLDSDTGGLLVSLDDASPYLDGYRIKLDIGNPSNAKFANAKLKVRWGRAWTRGDDFTKWQAALHVKEVSLTDNLNAGQWNPVTVDLVPCKPDELGYLEVSLQTPSILLHVQPSQ